MIPPVLSFTRADCDLIAQYGNARVRWSRVDATSKRKLANVRERVKQLIDHAAQRQTVDIPFAEFVAVAHPSERVPTDYWGCLYPAIVPGKAYALQLAFILAGNGVELCLTMGSGRREARDPKTAAQNRRCLELAQQGLALLPFSELSSIEDQLTETAGTGRGIWRFRKSSRQAPRSSDFETLAEWAHYAASPLGAGACISTNLSPSAVEKLGEGIVDRFVDMMGIFAPLLQFVYSDDSVNDAPPQSDASVAGLPRMVAEQAPAYGATSTRTATLAASGVSTHASGVAGPRSRVHPPAKPFTLDMAAADLFVARDELQRMLALLDRRRNLILEGAPGVGKTFIARRLAYALLGATDASRMEMVQFHPSYAYEDFVQGWRPAAGGSFVLRNGVFYEFCEAARHDLDRPYVFVIDEINRGNVSGIFGELLMLLEHDKRGDAHAVALTYTLGAGDRFAIPPNVYMIATMNTADRSLAMVDYALRRRFAFVRLPPAFGTPTFTSHLTRQGVSKSLTRRIATRMTALNTEIAADRKRLGPGFEIGHSMFVPAHAGPHDEAWYHEIVRTEIEPLLREYWFDDPDRAAEAIARLLA